MRPRCSFVCLLLLRCALAWTRRRFVFTQNNNFRNSLNWLDGNEPCENDKIFASTGNLVVGMIDVPIVPSVLVLPDNGVFFLDDAAPIGLKANKCKREEKGVQSVYFDGANNYASVFDPSNWHQTNPFDLHMNQVPSQRDDVMIYSKFGVQLSIPDTLSVGSLEMNGRNHTTRSFDLFIQTAEGEYQVQLSPLISEEQDKGGIQLQKAKRHVLEVIEADSNSFGIRSFNSNRDTLASICQSFEKAKEAPLPCADAVQPIGHCFPICGGVMNFTSHYVPIAEMQALIDIVGRELATTDKIHVALERIDDFDDSFEFEYQIVLLSKLGRDEYDEMLFARLAAGIKDRLSRGGTIYAFSIQIARQRDTNLVALVFIYILIASIILAAIFYQLNKHGRMPALNTIANFSISFHRKNNEDTVEFLMEEEIPHLVEDVDENCNPNFNEIELEPINAPDDTTSTKSVKSEYTLLDL